MPVSIVRSARTCHQSFAEKVPDIQRHKRGLSIGRQKAERDVQIRFRIENGGNVLSVSVTRSSGSDELDKAAIAMVRNSSPVPTPPEGVNKHHHAGGLQPLTGGISFAPQRTRVDRAIMCDLKT
jgi:TonB family protein